ncbi:MAG: hypothetical protein ACM3PZ_01585 [Bacillota bacterium]
MNKNDNTGLGLIKTTIERAQNEKSLFNSALKKLVNSTEEELADFLKKKMEKNAIGNLCCISGKEMIMIEALDGKAYISNAKKTFKSGIDEDFKKWGLNQSGLATAETLFDVSEMSADGTFTQIFTGITSDLDKIVMTQAQIIRFCEKYPTWLRHYATFFLTKVRGKYFVVYVYVRLDGLYVSVGLFERDVIWYGGGRHRVVSPQLIPLPE